MRRRIDQARRPAIEALERKELLASGQHIFMSQVATRPTAQVLLSAEQNNLPKPAPNQIIAILIG